jgi:5-methylcytosine-specific restriction endonuclease McrA
MSIEDWCLQGEADRRQSREQDWPRARVAYAQYRQVAARFGVTSMPVDDGGWGWVTWVASGYQAPHLWEMDHIVPVVEGGGGCGLGNLRTLCLACHRAETAELARRRARKRREATA